MVNRFHPLGYKNTNYIVYTVLLLVFVTQLDGSWEGGCRQEITLTLNAGSMRGSLVIPFHFPKAQTLSSCI